MDGVIQFPRYRRLDLAFVGRELARVAIYIDTRATHRREKRSMAPTLERLRHDRVEVYTAVDEAGVVGHRVVEACLLDRLQERGHLGRGDAGLERHSAGLFLRGLFHDSGMARRVTALLGARGGSTHNERPAAFEASTAASNSLADYCAIMSAMDTMILPVHLTRPLGNSRRRRLTHGVREVCLWDRWPPSFTGKEIRDGLDRLILVAERVVRIGDEEC